MKLRSFVICMFIGFCAFLSAQNPMLDYQRRQDSIRAAYKRHRDSVFTKYECFRDSCNTEYAKFLKEAWKSFEGHKGLQAPKEEMYLPKEVLEQMNAPQKIVAVETEKPEETAFNVREAIVTVRNFFKSLKPAEPLVVRERSSRWTRRKQVQEKKGEVRSEKEDGLQDVVVQKPKEIQQAQQITPNLAENEKEHVDETAVNLVSFDFYGTELQVDIGDLQEALKKLNLKTLTKDKVSEAWTLCSKSEYVGLIQDCLSLKRERHFGDWAYLQMIKSMTEKAFGSNTNESIFLTAYIYCQSGYRIRLGQDGDKLLMLFTTHHRIYNRDYWQIDNQPFYSLQPSQSLYSIDACDKAINSQEQPLSLWMTEPMVLDENPSRMRLIQSDTYPEMKMEVKVNENLIQYYNDYPNSQFGNDKLTRWAIYANTPLNEEVKNQIYEPLEKQLQGLREDEQICRLLSLVQPRGMFHEPEKSLIYEYDDSIWGCDRAFFPEETLYYRGSDCEDHAILFARLVRDLIKLKVLLVYYSAPGSIGGHLATAVHFNQEPTMGNGDALVYENETYYICDPTNWDPRPGVTMKGMNNKAAKVILLSSDI